MFIKMNVSTKREEAISIAFQITPNCYEVLLASLTMQTAFLRVKADQLANKMHGICIPKSTSVDLVVRFEDKGDVDDEQKEEGQVGQKYQTENSRFSIFPNFILL